MAKYRIMALPPSYKKGGGRKKKQVAQPGQWADTNPQIVQPGEEGFDLPTSSTAPGAEFAIQQMSPEEQAAYLKKARYDEAIASYKPLEAEYKGLTRPKGNLVLGEDYDADPTKFTSAGYYPIKTESGNYEMIANKDIANLIYQKGVNPDVLSKTFGLGSPEEIQKQFSPIYEHASGIHAKRNKEKIDGLIKSGMTKDQAIQSLVEQGEGNLEGLTNRYGSYTEEAFTKAQENAKKALETKQDDLSLKDQYSNYFKQRDEQYEAQMDNLKEGIDYGKTLTPSETTQKTAGAIYNPLTKTFAPTTSAYDKSEDKKVLVNKILDTKNQEQKERTVVNKVLDAKNLTDEQKKQYLEDPVAFSNLYNQYQQYEASPEIIQGSYMTSMGQSMPHVGMRSDFTINPVTKTSFQMPNVGSSLPLFGAKNYNKYGIPGLAPNNINMTNANVDWKPAAKVPKSAPSDAVNMLDKEWIAGVVGATAFPAVYSGVQTLWNAPILGAVGSEALPGLTLGNVSNAVSAFDFATKYGPDALMQGQKMYEEGYSDDRAKALAYDIYKGVNAAIPYTKYLGKDLEKINQVKKGKDALSFYDNANKSVQTPENVVENTKWVKGLGSVLSLPKQKGGSIQMELSDDEIDDYVKKGFIVEEVKVPAMQSGGTPSQLWYQYTGTPWSQAKAKGLTDGSTEQNLALAKRLQAGEFGEPKISTQQYQDVRSGYDQMVEQMVGQGKTLDELVAQKVGTREGLKYRFPELFKNESKKTTTATAQKSQAQKDAELKAAREWLTGKVKEIGNNVFNAIEDSYWGKLAKKAGSATIKYLEAEAAKDKAAKAKQAQKVKAVEKKVEKKVQSTVKKVTNPLPTPNIVDVLNNAGVKYEPKKQPIVPEQRPQKTPSVLDILNQKSIFDYDPLETLKKYAKPVEEKKPAPMTGYDIKGIVDQIQKGQKMGPPPSLTRQQSQQPLGDNSMAAQFKTNEQKGKGMKPLNLPEVKDKSIWDKAEEWGSQTWEDTKDLASDTWEGTKNLAEEYIADPIVESIFGEGVKDAPTSKEEFLETPTGKQVGKKILEWNDSEENWIDPMGPFKLDKFDKERLRRKLEKEGVIDTPEPTLENKKEPEKVIQQTPKPNNIFEEKGFVKDSYAPQYNIFSYRSQWNNDDGFEYIPTGVFKDRSEKDEYKDVVGVGHFVLDASPLDGKTYMHPNNINYLRRAMNNNDYIPVYESLKNGRLTLKYKKYSELSAKQKENLNSLFKNFDKLGSYNADWPSAAHQALAQQYAQQQDSLGVKVISPLRQMKLSDIDFSKTQRPAGFQDPIKEIMTKDNKGTYLIFKNRDGYSRFSGGSVVFIFKDKYGNTIVRDFAGTLNNIETEAINIQKQYGLKPEEITLGYHDVGSFSAKPKADNKGVLKTAQWHGYNKSDPENNPTGAALIIPKRK